MMSNLSRTLINVPITLKQTRNSVLTSVLPKAVGSMYRVWDDRRAPVDIKTKTILREASILAQVMVYASIIDLATQLLECKAKQAAIGTGNKLLSFLYQKMKNNHTMVTIGIACTANCVAELVSRKIAPRDIWNKNQSGLKALVPAKSDKSQPETKHGEDKQDHPGFFSHGSKSAPLHEPLTFSANASPRLQKPFYGNPFERAILSSPVNGPAFSV